MRAMSVRQTPKHRGSCQNSERSAGLMEICAVVLIGQQGSYRSWKDLEFKSHIFQAWKILESCLRPGRSWKVIEMRIAGVRDSSMISV